MRTTLDIEEDMLVQAKDLARREGATIGQIVSRLLRNALQAQEPPLVRNGIPLFRPTPGAARPSLELVNRLRDEQ